MMILGAVLIAISAALVTAILLFPAHQVVGTARALELIRDAGGDATRGSARPSARTNRLTSTLARIGVRLTPAGTPDRLRQRLDSLGPNSFWTVQTAMAGKAIGTLILGGVGLLVWLNRPGLTTFALGVAFALLGYWFVDALLYNSITKRRELLRRTAADVLDMLTICVEAGLGFDAALRQVVDNSRSPLAEEFSRVLREFQLGRGRAEAFTDLAKRCDVVEVSNFVAAVVQADRLGVPIAAVLREQASELRLRRRQTAEEEAQKIPVKIIFPVLFCIFPAFFVIVIGPAVINIVKAFSG